VLQCVFVPIRVVLIRVVPSRVSCSCRDVPCWDLLTVRVVPCRKWKKINHATFKNTIHDTCRAGTDRHARCAVSLSYRFVLCRALTRGHNFITLPMTSLMDYPIIFWYKEFIETHKSRFRDDLTIFFIP
jgi:hypothetical protein